MSLELPAKRQDEAPNAVAMPSPTAWPIVLAFGITLVFAGMLTTGSVSMLGAVLALSGYAGWFRDVLPHEKHDSVPVLEQPAAEAKPRRRGFGMFVLGFVLGAVALFGLALYASLNSF